MSKTYIVYCPDTKSIIKSWHQLYVLNRFETYPPYSSIFEAIDSLSLCSGTNVSSIFYKLCQDVTAPRIVVRADTKSRITIRTIQKKTTPRSRAHPVASETDVLNRFETCLSYSSIFGFPLFVFRNKCFLNFLQVVSGCNRPPHARSYTTG